MSERTCQNILPGHTEPCGAPWDGHESASAIDACAECRSAANALIEALGRVLQRRAELDATEAA